MNKERNIKQNDFTRCLVTDMLPYEIPFIFSNERFRENIKKKAKLPDVVKTHILSSNCSTLPYNFNVLKPEGGNRVLSVIHPSAQVEFVDFYKSYRSLFISLCSRSDFSLRHPYKTASYVCEEDSQSPFAINPDGSGEPSSVSSKQDESASTFFAYKTYGAIYSFYDSKEFHQLEKKYKYLKKLDISKCFESIYTHSIAWAVKSKRFAKDTIGHRSFEDSFDFLMRSTNDNETAGIVVGPEVSRIFAEIILQKIDLEVKNSVTLSYNREEFEVKRYVDDYFLFYNDVEVGEELTRRFSEKLRHYKLHLNESKSEILTRPFSSAISIAKNNLNTFLDMELKALVPQDEDDLVDMILIEEPAKKSNAIIYSLKCIIKEGGTDYSCTSSFIFAKILKWYVEILTEYSNNGFNSNYYQQNLANVIDIILDLSFFIYSMHSTDNTTYYLTKILSLTISALDNNPDSLSFPLKSKIRNEAVAVLTSSSSTDRVFLIERINLFLILSCLGEEHLLTEEEIRKIFNLTTPPDNSSQFVSFFHIVSILYYIEDVETYSRLRANLVEIINLKFLKIKKPLIHTELALLFVDVLTCPYISRKDKLDIAKKVYKAQTGTKNDLKGRSKELVDYFSRKCWFTYWGERNRTSSQKHVDFAYFLKKKRKHPPY